MRWLHHGAKGLIVRKDYLNGESAPPLSPASLRLLAEGVNEGREESL
jgi:hypothetical protein